MWNTVKLDIIKCREALSRTDSKYNDQVMLIRALTCCCDQSKLRKMRLKKHMIYQRCKEVAIARRQCLKERSVLTQAFTRGNEVIVRNIQPNIRRQKHDKGNNCTIQKVPLDESL